ncbi:hypothetical protein A1O3_10379 [Capronia epimyces CBS 606.96]|uniref:Uncharacterized protein n=1 Tax=Capronia epimyces CBS 606.96 TaxID=1182542 RepID=W9XJS2_9EURO|nr:uncharacterized protein A1O3_10379 [Capronia epimyces CBS 606.96]EXJ77221.1 hypothetical protein A1O3_10379 [Capronia epimyces CBS 606.96]
MCVRTKTSYGCGCEFKTTVECHSSHCQGLERYHYPREGDCRTCKLGGDGVTRGREGRGRHAQEISRHARTEGASESSDDRVLSPLEIGGGISPWAVPLKREKEWHSPSRKKADDAWLEEHVERNSDLQTIRESMSACAIPDQASTAFYSPSRRARGAHEYEHDDSHHRRERDEYYGQPRRGDTVEWPLHIEIRSVPDHGHGSNRRPVRRHRHDSQESFESTPSSRSSRKYKPAPTTYTTYDHFEPYDSGYGSYGSRASHGYEVAKTEPYTYSPIPRTVSIKPPSTASHGVYQTGFGVGGVDVVSRAPLFAYSTRRH